MLSWIGKTNSPCCDGIRRRDFISAGSLGVLGLSLPELLRAERAQAAAPRAKSILLVYLGGGITHHDTFDPKPEAPEEIRGKYGQIDTRTPGVRFSDQMPSLAACSNLFALVRSQVAGSDHHETAAQWMLTGNYGVMQGGDYPAIGAIVHHELGAQNSLPPYVAVPRNHSFTWELGKSAWLGEQYESFKSGDPAQPGWKVTNLALQADVDRARLGRRNQVLAAIDGLARKVGNSPDLKAMDSCYQRAAQMVLSEDARLAFDLTRESEKTLDAYGKTERWGRQALLARRLIESGVRFVFLQYSAWDHHAKIFESCDRMLKPFDQALAALLKDMNERGLLKDTLVAVYGDFGRTSKINKDAGRDHWGNAGSMLFAGAGVRGGQVIGKTDARGEYVLDRPVRPPDVAATLYDAVGIDFHKELHTPQARPVRVLPPDAAPIHELYG